MQSRLGVISGMYKNMNSVHKPEDTANLNNYHIRAILLPGRGSWGSVELVYHEYATFPQLLGSLMSFFSRSTCPMNCNGT